MAKGGVYERVVCHQLSRWWSGGVTDDGFWRTAGSGGRSTNRAKKGKKTRGHAGDICATDADGEPLTKLITWEIKRGYNDTSIADLFDGSTRIKKQSKIEAFIEQAMAAAERAGTPYWALVYRRDSRESMVLFPGELMSDLRSAGSFCPPVPRPFFRMEVVVRLSSGKESFVRLAGMSLAGFFESVRPADVRAVLEGN